MLYHAVSDTYVLFHMPIFSPLKKTNQTNQKPKPTNPTKKTPSNQNHLIKPNNKQNTCWLPGRNASHNYWKFSSAGNISAAHVFLCLVCIRYEFSPYVRGHERQVILFNLVLVWQLMFSLLIYFSALDDSVSTYEQIRTTSWNHELQLPCYFHAQSPIWNPPMISHTFM